MKVWTTLLVVMMASTVWGASWYVSKSGGNNTTGASWTTAWNELNQVKWASVSPGDTVKIGGGTYTTALTLSKAGTAGNRIRIMRSTEAGHDGKVVMTGSTVVTAPYTAAVCVLVTQPYITLDGIDYRNFEFRQAGITYIQVNFSGSKDYFEVKNASFWNTPDITCWMRSIDVPSGNLSVDHCFLDKSQCSEDIFRFQSTGSLKIQNSVMRGWISISGSHSDLVEGGGTGHTMDSLIVRHNLVDDAVTGGHNIAFMTGYTAFDYVDFAYNVFKGIYMVSQANSYQYARWINNTLYDCTYGGSCSIIANNIFSCSANFYLGSSMTNCLWAPGTGSFISGNGNLQSDPQFTNPASILGADSLPFTADDGFHIQSSSPAINKGTNVGQTVDIMGNPIVGTPDIGAYEFSTTGLRTADCELRIGPAAQALMPNPVRAAWLQAYMKVQKSLLMCDLTGKAIDDGSPLRPGVYLVKRTDETAGQKVFVVR